MPPGRVTHQQKSGSVPLHQQVGKLLDRRSKISQGQVWGAGDPSILEGDDRSPGVGECLGQGSQVGAVVLRAPEATVDEDDGRGVPVLGWQVDIGDVVRMGAVDPCLVRRSARATKDAAVLSIGTGSRLTRSRGIGSVGIGHVVSMATLLH